MAAQQVLDLPELLESILLILPMRDLLLAQRVSKTFQQVILSSPHIQRALFFAPGKGADVNLSLAQDMHNHLGDCVANPPYEALRVGQRLDPTIGRRGAI
ncbi:hypothetical protein LTR42_012129 [Elasticomyces elasticus]|nr:hypothetical protein LTR42_012129 [Elasticomyces elasticus]